MVAVAQVQAPELMEDEWRRVEILARCSMAVRNGGGIPSALLDELAAVQGRVATLRQSGQSWAELCPVDLDPTFQDVLACVIAPEAEPRIGWLYQGLHPGASHTYATPALLQELLALDAASATGLYTALSEASPLRRYGLIRLDGGMYEAVRPGAGVSAHLLNRPVLAAPPGTTEITRLAGWHELVVPPDRVVMLREFVAWVRRRDTVVGEWGGRTLGGPIALFTGTPGTGKTMAATVVASELGWPLYRVDLGMLVSKYVGETEKNLNALFDAAHGRPMVLQFDEADSVFSKRGEIREARDRYANLEVSHLLARIESHQGPCILTTNLRHHLDTAFTRRFQVVIDFPRPDAEARARLWTTCLPPGAPLEDEVDPSLLGLAVNLTGGDIQNAALHAAYVAADEARRIGLQDIALAVWRELGKDGREVHPSDLGPLAAHLPVGKVSVP